MFKEEKTAGEAVKVCLTCSKWTSNYMTVYEMGRCAHDPAWTSRPHNAHCDRHVQADNIARRLAWLANKREAK